MRSSLSTLGATLDVLNAPNVVTSVVAIRDQGGNRTDCGPMWPTVHYARCSELNLAGRPVEIRAPR